MKTIDITVKSIPAKGKKLSVEIDAERLERLAANFGLFNPDFLKSVHQAERDYSSGRTRTIKSFKEITS